MDGRDDPPWVTFPERLDRRLRLGPFASGRDAVKFVTAAAVGAVVSLSVAPWAGLPVVVVGAVVALWRPDGEPLDERAAAVARWSWRRSLEGGRMTVPIRATERSGRATVLLPDGRSAAVVRTGGIPLAFLPPAELGRQFELYRQLLRSVDGGLIVHVTTAPMYAAAVLPVERPAGEPERAAYDGYRELVALLARRRAVRRVLVALVQDATHVEGARRLEASVDLLRERLADLGLRSERLRDRTLTEAARRLGFTAQEPGR
jgi:hypothetical protein